MHGNLGTPRGRPLKRIVALGVKSLGARVRDRDLDAIAARWATSHRATGAVAASGATVAPVVLTCPTSVYPQGQPLFVKPVT